MQRSSSLNGMDLAKCGIAVLLGFPAMSMGAPTAAWGGVA